MITLGISLEKHTKLVNHINHTFIESNKQTQKNFNDLGEKLDYISSQNNSLLKSGKIPNDSNLEEIKQTLQKLKDLILS